MIVLLLIFLFWTDSPEIFTGHVPADIIFVSEHAPDLSRPDLAFRAASYVHL